MGRTCPGGLQGAGCAASGGGGGWGEGDTAGGAGRQPGVRGCVVGGRVSGSVHSNQDVGLRDALLSDKFARGVGEASGARVTGEANARLGDEEGADFALLVPWCARKEV
jgi:hypothetical protein